MERKGRDNGYTRVLDEFHDIMRQYVSAAIGAPVVFIVSEASAGSGGGSAVHRLFPPDTFAPPACSQIQFNAVNMTLMKRVLALICKHEKLDLDKSTVEKWAEAGGGDIRNAVSMLQFGTVVSKTRGDASKVSAKRGAKKIRGKADKDEHSNNEQFDPTSAGVCGKDDTIFLLHAAGKVLHNKRTILVKHSAEYKKFDKRLPKQNQRFDLKYDPEELVQKVRTSGLKFRLLLHENCVPFFNDMDSMVEASEYQSDADILDHWQHPLQQELATLVSVRGLSYSRPGTDAKGPGWMPLHGTKW
ncbi:hypothetical protein SARC_13224 [Sphaeroforma arctica JP610]|uniref:Uncharacterized protein n=1 Tax=Sphaeroforma arctica JP610 TaxID=667725 RepID=A0A0L0FDT4_9EUKA|nr:hypothetical protein SARC_13224 [Sphaeroforma arctica JP610]KNC74223.1 hypothetical protein SARC_13224 [Sphaeroforma arctica JP610]|eukprot:XP_014148125.1 hypothetical protein SARC_13224 [Sphaeroforma arctica JP610]